MIVIAHRLSTIQNAGVCAATTCLKLNSQQYSVWLIFMCVCVCVCECGCVDIIAVVQNGTVTESGTHAQLVESSPFYSKAVGIHTLPHHRRVGSYRASFFRDASCAPAPRPATATSHCICVLQRSIQLTGWTRSPFLCTSLSACSRCNTKSRATAQLMGPLAAPSCDVTLAE